jgi:hypothetical protein
MDPMTEAYHRPDISGDGGLYGDGLRRILRLGDQRHRFDDVQPGPPQKLVNHRAGQPRSVILHPHRLCRLVDHHAADPIHVAYLGKRKSSGLGGRNPITVEHIQLSHTSNFSSDREAVRTQVGRQ